MRKMSASVAVASPKPPRSKLSYCLLLACVAFNNISSHAFSSTIPTNRITSFIPRGTISIGCRSTAHVGNWLSNLRRHHSSSTILVVRRAATPSDDKGQQKYDQGEVGRGANWIEKSFPVDTEEGINIKKVEDYNLGICGADFQTGSLSRRMFDTIVSRTRLDVTDEIRQAFTLYAMDFTAKEATRAALRQNGLEMSLQQEEEDQGMWGDIEAIRLYDLKTREPLKKMYDSMEEAVEDWTPGQNFDFVVRQVPAKVRELSIEELVQALDPDGALREEARELKGEPASPDEEALLSIFDDGYMSSLADLANDNVRRTENAPREVTDEKTAFVGTNSRGYRVIKRSDLLRDSINRDGTENNKSKFRIPFTV
jgi:hypothetical protein